MRGWVYLHTLDPPIAVASTVWTHILEGEGGEGGREGGREGGGREGGRERGREKGGRKEGERREKGGRKEGERREKGGRGVKMVWISLACSSPVYCLEH